jgi:hypothetical protein
MEALGVMMATLDQYQAGWKALWDSWNALSAQGRLDAVKQQIAYLDAYVAAAEAQIKAWLDEQITAVEKWRDEQIKLIETERDLKIELLEAQVPLPRPQAQLLQPAVLGLDQPLAQVTAPAAGGSGGGGVRRRRRPANPQLLLC